MHIDSTSFLHRTCYLIYVVDSALTARNFLRQGMRAV